MGEPSRLKSWECTGLQAVPNHTRLQLLRVVSELAQRPCPEVGAKLLVQGDLGFQLGSLLVESRQEVLHIDREVVQTGKAAHGAHLYIASTKAGRVFGLLGLLGHRPGSVLQRAGCEGLQRRAAARAQRLTAARSSSPVYTGC